MGDAVKEAERILAFWLDEVGPEGWYGGDDDLDARCRDEFFELWRSAQDGALDGWTAQPRACLALVILLDQFPRNMFRGAAQAFATDAKALAIAKSAIARGFDLRIDGVGRLFFYMPFMHSEMIGDQERCVRLLALRLPENLLHGRAHRMVIRRFGRFPYRNEALGRRTTVKEAAFLAKGGYAAALAEVDEPVDAAPHAAAP